MVHRPALLGVADSRRKPRASPWFAFERLTVDQVVSVIDADNTQSIRVAEKIGETCHHTEFL
ncbi:GNAT family N-acetyltransferase [Protofrankia symbiont of Coriaria ruscifolia]|nr:GNAT family N-acetyltransferase [Protofrankia symbiont of Coriaria ruscifolia]